MADDVLTIFAEGRVDAKSLSGFMSEPVGKLVHRRLAPPVESFDTHIDKLTKAETAAALIVQTIPNTVNDAINNTAIEGGILADTFVTVTSNLPNSVPRNLREVNSERTSIHTFGDCGKGANDSSVFNLAITTLYNDAVENGGTRTLTLVAGRTYSLRNVVLKPFVDFVCEGGLATIKRLDVPEGVTEASVKFWDMLSIDQNKFKTAKECGHRIQLQNILFNGNIEGARWSGGYAQEQSRCLTLYHPQGGLTINERAKIGLNNCHFYNSVSDGVLIGMNIDLIANNCTGVKCFRGGLVITGGNSIIKVNGWYAEDARTDIEVDSLGFGGEGAIVAHISNYYQDTGPCKFAQNRLFTGGVDIIAYAGSDIVLNNFHCYSERLVSYLRYPATSSFVSKLTGKRIASLQVTNSTLPVNDSFFYGALDVGIKDTKLLLVNDAAGVSWIRVDSNFGRPTNYDLVEIGKIEFNNINLEWQDSTAASLKPLKSLVSFTEQKAKVKDLTSIINSDISNIEMGILFVGAAGVRLKVDNVKAKFSVFSYINGYFGQSSSSHGVNFELGYIENIAITSSNTLIILGEVGGNKNTVKYLPNYILKLGHEKITLVNGMNGAWTTQEGFRTIVGDKSVDNSVWGVATDIYRKSNYLNNAGNVVGYPYEWYCTNKKGGESTSGKWIATKWLVGSFATTSLPVLTVNDVGAQNIDTTLNKMVTWTGTAWI